MPDVAPRRRRIFSIVAWSTLAFNLAVVAGGTVVRATGSGDGCGQTWPKCGDQFVPPNATIETLIEYTHRVSSVLAGVGVAALFAGMLLRDRIPTKTYRNIVRRVLFLLAFLLIAQYFIQS